MHEQASFDARQARRWLTLAVGSLLVAGVFAVILVVGRMPPFSEWVTDPLFFKRCLVVHVDLALVVWFYAFLGSLFFTLPVRRSLRLLDYLGLGLSVVGLLMVIGSVFIRGVQPVLANYVPVLDHPAFVLGLALFGLGLGVTFLDGRLLTAGEAREGVLPVPGAARAGLRAAAIAFLIALITFGAGWLSTPSGLATKQHFELAFWGGGHVLQFASAIAMVVVWLIMLSGALGRSPIGRGPASLLFGLLLLPLLAAPLLASSGTESGAARSGFTLIMQLGIFPAVTVFLICCLRALWRAKREGRLVGAWGDPRITGFAISAALTVLGFVLGAMITGPNTMVPAHYHASIGGVTAAFMAVTYVLLEPVGLPIRSPRLRRLSAFQPLLFGVGQMVFATGFALAGASGAARKTYGAEQAIRSQQEWIGLVVMGLGGLVAVAGGILFLTIVVAAWRHRFATNPSPSSGRAPWDKSPSPSIPSRSF